MRKRMLLSLTIACAFAASLAAQGPRLKLETGALTARAKEVVDLNIDKSTMSWALESLKSKDVDAESVQALLKELDSINVQVLEFGKENAPSWDELLSAAKGALQELDGPQWKRIISVTEKGAAGSEIVRLCLFNNPAGEVGGLAVLAIEPKELVLVNVVGKVRLDQLNLVGKLLGKPGLLGSAGDGKASPPAKDQEKPQPDK